MPVSKAVAKVKETVAGKSAAPEKANGASKPAAKPVVGDVITLDGFGGEIETNDGEKTTLKALVAESKSGVVLFTYPKASTPGCTNQACMFRDNYEPFTKDGLAIYGLSTDSPKANTTFKDKQKLPYPLLCDPSATLIGAIGLKKAPKGTTRGVFAIDKTGKVLLAQPGGPAATVDAVKELVAAGGESAAPAAAAEAETKEEEPETAVKPVEAATLTNGDPVAEEKTEEAIKEKESAS
ncbi:Peroxiredoxin bcp1 [Apiospora rasikravindrae]|uniref:thioredoxin-dependent peroxiredoxin n=1 Tax=Apiospora rasikravindrae TaxID=990691 RepID=A0ABR1T5X8_9PEZI